MNEESVFTKIIKGELPSHKVYEDNLTLAIIPLHPIALGHVLVISKKQVDKFYDLEDTDYIALMNSVKKVAKRMSKIIDAKRVGIKIAGIDVPHTHVHVVAFNTIKQFNEVPSESSLVDHEQLTQMAQKLSF